ncbi:hypothetical protein ACLOJK_006824 [Asimina triloba]
MHCCTAVTPEAAISFFTDFKLGYYTKIPPQASAMVVDQGILRKSSAAAIKDNGSLSPVFDLLPPISAGFLLGIICRDCSADE